MLAELEIENLAVIAHARIPFSPRLNVFTGETGAGKSILLHGIHAVLGQRVTRDIVRTGCKKAVVTALFTHLDPLVCARLDALSISHVDDELLLTREIAADGGSAARVNGHTTTVSVLVPSVCFSIIRCWSAITAIWDKWVTQSTCRSCPTSRSFMPIFCAALPLTPVSISSKISVGMLSRSAITHFSASMIRDSSPPDAMRARGLGSSPRFAEMRNSRLSMP